MPVDPALVRLAQERQALALAVRQLVLTWEAFDGQDRRHMDKVVARARALLAEDPDWAADERELALERSLDRLR